MGHYPTAICSVLAAWAQTQHRTVYQLSKYLHWPGAVPVELFEIAVPILTLRRDYLQDSGGAGAKRGGLAQRIELQILPGYDGTATVSIRAAGQNVPPFGLNGGHGGKPAEVLQDGRILTREEKFQQASTLSLTNSQTVIGFDTAAGGGYGSPLDRAIESVQQDVRSGYISLEQAEIVYGVILDPMSLTPDLAATAKQRQKLQK